MVCDFYVPQVSEEHTPVLQFLKELTSQSEISQENGFLIEKLKERWVFKQNFDMLKFEIIFVF